MVGFGLGLAEAPVCRLLQLACVEVSDGLERMKVGDRVLALRLGVTRRSVTSCNIHRNNITYAAHSAQQQKADASCVWHSLSRN